MVETAYMFEKEAFRRLHRKPAYTFSGVNSILPASLSGSGSFCKKKVFFQNRTIASVFLWDNFKHGIKANLVHCPYFTWPPSSFLLLALECPYEKYYLQSPFAQQMLAGLTSSLTLLADLNGCFEFISQRFFLGEALYINPSDELQYEIIKPIQSGVIS